MNLISQSNCALNNDRSVIIPDEELLFDICDLLSSGGSGGTVSSDLAMTSMARIQKYSPQYPIHILVSVFVCLGFINHK